MIDETVFLGLSESIWQGIFSFLSTIIVAGAVGFITIHWLSKQEALNEREGKILNDRITAYLEIAFYVDIMTIKKTTARKH